MGVILRGPWSIKPETINKEGNDSGYKTMNYFLAKERQEHAYKANVYLELYIINNDYNRVFLLSSTKENVEWQINFRQENPIYIEGIKKSL